MDGYMQTSMICVYITKYDTLTLHPECSLLRLILLSNFVVHATGFYVNCLKIYELLLRGILLIIY